jgi:hypothetical protein
MTSFRYVLVLGLSACTLLQPKPAVEPSPAPDVTPREAEAPPKPESAEPDAPLGSVESAHPTIAWFVMRVREVPGIALGKTGRARPTAALVRPFLLDRAISTIAPACLRDYKLTKTAAALAKVPPITDASRVETARAAIAQIGPLSNQELVGKDYSDRANGEGTAQAVTQALDKLAADAATSTPLDVEALRGWIELLEVCFDSTRPRIVERVLGQYHELLLTGKPPARGATVRVRPVHEAIATYVRVIGEQLSVHEMAELLSVDVGDTRRGTNLAVALFAADVAIRELAVRTLRACGAAPEADRIANVAPVQSSRALTSAATLLMGFDSSEGANRFCIGAGQGAARSAIGAASDAQDYLRQGINSHPSYARSALTGWTEALRGLTDLRVDTQGLGRDLLARAVTKLRSLPRRTEGPDAH